MRKILFRGWCKDGMDWIYGGGLVMNSKSKTGYISGYIDEPPIRVPAHSVGQYTGFEDCYKEKIFEGDVLERDDRELMLVEFDEKKGMWVAVQDEHHTYSLAELLNGGKQVRVWGNMWEDFDEWLEEDDDNE